MTTKNRDSLKDILKSISKERNAETLIAINLKDRLEKQKQEMEDNGWARIIREEETPRPLRQVFEEPKPIKKAKPKPKIDPEKDHHLAEEKALLEKELQEAKDKLATIEVAKELEKEDPEVILE